MSSMLRSMYEMAAFKAEDFLAERPDADAGALVAYLRSLAADSRYVDAPDSTPGRYRIVRGRAETAAWVELVLRKRVDIEERDEAIRRIVQSPDAIRALAADEDGKLILKAVELQRRYTDLVALREIIEDPSASEAEIQKSLKGQHWIFGGQFVGESARRNLVLGNEIDIPLLRADGALHIVELKRAMSLKTGIVTRPGGSLVPSAEVHHAVSQALNYLVHLDENRHQVRAMFGIEARRASALVLIGHPALHPEYAEDEVNESLRIFNAHISRVEVLTYKTLMDNALRSLGETVEDESERS